MLTPLTQNKLGQPPEDTFQCMLPFSTEQFFQVFGTFNLAIWPAQIFAYGVALLALVALLRSGPIADRVVAACLASMWLFTGIAYQWVYFARINPLAEIFAAAFVVEAGLLTYTAARGFPPSRAPDPVRGGIGAILVLYAAVAYPLIGFIVHGYPQVALFGVTPCPVTIFTLGCFMLTSNPFPWWALVVPALWSMIGGSAAVLLNVPQDWVLLAAGPLVVTFEVRARFRGIERDQIHLSERR